MQRPQKPNYEEEAEQEDGVEYEDFPSSPPFLRPSPPSSRDSPLRPPMAKRYRGWRDRRRRSNPLSFYLPITVGIDIPDYIASGGGRSSSNAIKSMSDKMKALG